MHQQKTNIHTHKKCRKVQNRDMIPSFTLLSNAITLVVLLKKGKTRLCVNIFVSSLHCLTRQSAATRNLSFQTPSASESCWQVAYTHIGNATGSEISKHYSRSLYTWKLAVYFFSSFAFTLTHTLCLTSFSVTSQPPSTHIQIFQV